MILTCLMFSKNCRTVNKGFSLSFWADKLGEGNDKMFWVKWLSVVLEKWWVDIATQTLSGFLTEKNLGGVGGCGALMVVQAATTPPNMQAGKMMFKSGMFSGEELTITGASKEPGFWSHFRILSHQSCSVNNSWLQTNLDQSIISHQLVSMTKHTPINSRITNHM